MSGNVLNRVVSRLLTDRRFLLGFRRSPEEALRRYGLPADQLAAVKAGDEEKLVAFGMDPAPYCPEPRRGAWLPAALAAGNRALAFAALVAALLASATPASSAGGARRRAARRSKVPVMRSRAGGRKSPPRLLFAPRERVGLRILRARSLTRRAAVVRVLGKQWKRDLVSDRKAVMDLVLPGRLALALRSRARAAAARKRPGGAMLSRRREEGGALARARSAMARRARAMWRAEGRVWAGRERAVVALGMKRVLFGSIDYWIGDPWRDPVHLRIKAKVPAVLESPGDRVYGIKPMRCELK